MTEIGRKAATQLRLEYGELEAWDCGGIVEDASEALLRTQMGVLFDGDCLDVMSRVRDETVDLVFADPPFNLGKLYGKQVNDSLAEEQYVEWCRAWIDEGTRILRPGGAFFLYNLPRWNVLLGAHLLERHGFWLRHWIAISQKTVFPIQGRLYPAHYSLLYCTKGKPRVFRKLRTPIELCRHCGREIKDYGGHRKAMNPKGVNLTDVWTDVPPVRHRKYKASKRSANALSTKILDRVVEISTEPSDVVLDPFGGSGTTYAVCERRHRHWIGMDLESAGDIADRLTNDRLPPHANGDFIDIK